MVHFIEKVESTGARATFQQKCDVVWTETVPALGDGRRAGGGEAAHALDLDDADAARSVRFQVIVRAEGGMKNPFSSAAFRTVCPFRATTASPSMVMLTVSSN